MRQTQALIVTLKQALKAQRLTYADVAEKLDMSEANVKRMFASKRFTLDRIEEICQVMDMSLSDLFQLFEESRQRITRLTEDQEKELVSDVKLLLVAVSVRNRFCFEEIVQHYTISKTECIHYLAKLDKLKIIDLLPNNRFKLRIAEDFQWLANGPIERFFETQIQSQFLQSTFHCDGDVRLFLSGMLSEASQQIVNKRLNDLAKEFAELHRQDTGLAIEKRRNIGLLLAGREWEFEAFTPLRRT